MPRCKSPPPQSSPPAAQAWRAVAGKAQTEADATNIAPAAAQSFAATPAQLNASSAPGLFVYEEVRSDSSSESGEDDEALCLAVLPSANQSDRSAVLEGELDNMIEAGVRQDAIHVHSSRTCSAEPFFHLKDLERWRAVTGEAADGPSFPVYSSYSSFR